MRWSPGLRCAKRSESGPLVGYVHPVAELLMSKTVKRGAFKKRASYLVSILCSAYFAHMAQACFADYLRSCTTQGCSEGNKVGSEPENVRIYADQRLVATLDAVDYRRPGASAATVLQIKPSRP